MKNPHLKRANEECEYDVSHIEEMQKCAISAEYFLNNFCMIQHAVKGAIPFHLFPYQKRVVNAFQDNRLVITLAPRQIGKCLNSSTSVTALDVSSINTIKKFILWIFDRKLYNEIYKNV